MTKKTVPQLVVEVLKSSSQPLSLAEICHRVTKLRGKPVHVTQVRDVVKALRKRNEVAARLETKEERLARGSGNRARGGAATLYSYGSTVPKRTEALADITLGDGKTTRFYIKTNSKAFSNVDFVTHAKSLLEEHAVLKKRLIEIESQIKAAQEVLSR
jgi:hypothetical protein